MAFQSNLVTLIQFLRLLCKRRQMNEHIRDLIVMELVDNITPAEQEELDALVSADPGVKALRDEIRRKLTTPWVTHHLQELTYFSLSDVIALRKRQMWQTRKRVAIFSTLLLIALAIYFFLTTS